MRLSFSCTIIIGFGETLRRTQLAAKVQSEQLRITLASIGDGVITTDTEARVTSLNAAAESLTGWTLEQAAGRHLEEVFCAVNEETRERVESPTRMALRKSAIIGTHHTVLIAKDRSERPIDASAAPIHDEQGAVVGRVLVFRDVAERRRADVVLRRSERDLSDFFENASVGLHWVGPDGTILRVNQTELDLMGYTRAEYVGRNIAEFHVDQEVIADILARLTQGETLWEYSARLRRKDGTTIDVAISSSVLFEDGRFVHTRCFTRDTTREKRSDDALRNSEQQMRLITDAMPGLISFIDTDLRYRYVNRQYELWFGHDREEVLGKPVAQVLGQAAMAQLRPYMERALRGEEARFEIEVPYRHGGTRWIDARYVPHRNENGSVAGFFVLVLDVTARKLAEMELREADRRKDEFLATLAHELRNPLAPLANMLQVMKRVEDDRELVAQARATMEAQLGSLVRLVDDLLDLSRVTRNKLELRKERVELSGILRHALETCRPLVEGLEHEVTLSLPPEAIYLHADPVRLAQVFNNLLNNACKYSERKGRIWVSAERSGSDVLVKVKDAGVGIPPDQLDSIFEMFTQVDRSLERSQGGLGIGLTLVKRLTDLHEGTVEAFSAGVGRGSEFVVRLPVLTSLAEAPAPILPTAGEQLTPRRILVVDDNPDSAASLAMLLRLGGNETHTAHDGLEAVTAAAEVHPEVVLLDIGLPKLNGYDAARRIRAQPGGKDMVLIALSGWGQEEYRRQSKDAGFDAHMVKPVDFAALTKLLATLPAARGGRPAAC